MPSFLTQNMSYFLPSPWLKGKEWKRSNLEGGRQNKRKNSSYHPCTPDFLEPVFQSLFLLHSQCLYLLFCSTSWSQLDHKLARVERVICGLFISVAPCQVPICAAFSIHDERK